MNTSSFRKNKKGAAMIYAIMVLLLLSTVIVALTALASASYTDAVLSVSDDQSYYYAKSIGLAVKEQFKDGYSIAKIIDALNKEEATHDQKWANGEYYDPVVKGTFNITGEDGHLVNGTVQCRYARKADDSANRNVIEVTAACVVNNSPSVVTSVYSCEKDTGEEADHLAETLTDYDVVLTTGVNQNFDFTQASDSSNSSSVNVYVYTDEDASTSEKTFPLYYNMYGKLTTTGKVLISSMTSKSNSNPTYHIISGNLTSYGDMTLKYTGVQGAYGLHADGNVVLKAMSFVTKDIYAHGNVTIEDPGAELHGGYFWADGAGGRFIAGDTAYHSANNIAATGNVTLGKRAYVTGSVYSQGDVSVMGKGATPGQSGYTDHFGNTCVRGSIYAQGSVTISNGAVVVGDVIATKGVIIEKGAVVMGNVTSVNEGVSVLGSAVGGEVHAKTYLWVQNYQTAQGYIPQADYSSYARYLREFDVSGTGVVFYGGIGLLQPAGKTYKHTCKYFGTDDGDYVTIVRGDLHVSGAIESDYTPFLSVWCTDSVYLEGSRARFTDVKTRICEGISPNNAYHMSGVSIYPYVYVYTYIHELNQKRDFCETSGDNPYLDMYGARIDVLNIGSSYVNDLYDGYLFKGWVGNVNARCLYLADMHLDGYVYAAQYCYTWGTASAWAASNANYGAYYFANGLTQSTGTIEVACRGGMYYNGRFNNETHLGYWLGKRCWIYGLVNVGYEQYDDSYVILGDESDRGSSYLIGGINACVGDFYISPNMRLSDSNDLAVAPTWAATILAEINDGYSDNPNYVAQTGRPAAASNSFYVAPSGDYGGKYRVGSMIQVKGNAYVAGWVGDFQHFKRDDGSGDFVNTTTARLKGVFVSTGVSLNLIGTDVFNEVQSTNVNATVKLTGALTLNVLRVNGKLDVNKKALTVNGDCYIGELTSADIYSTTVKGNLTIGSINNSQDATLTAFNKLAVTGDLYLMKGNIALSKSAHKVSGTVQTGAGNLTVSGGAAVTHAYVNGWLNVQTNGAVTGDFLAVYLNVTGGTVGVYGQQADATVGYYIHSGGLIQRLHVNCIVTTADSVQISGTATGDGVYIDTLGGAIVSGGAGVDYKDGSLRSDNGNVVIRGGFQCGITANKGNITIGADGDTGEYMVGTAYTKGYPEDAAEDKYKHIYASGYVLWNGKAARGAFDESPKYAGATTITAGDYIKIGTESMPVKGLFNSFISKNKSVEAYVGAVGGVNAKTTAKVYVMGINSKNTAGYIGSSFGGDLESSQGIIAGGDIHVKWLVSDRGAKTKMAVMNGHFETSGNFYFDGSIDTVARIKCKDVYNLDKVQQHDGALYLSLYLFAPTGNGSIKKDSDGFFVLKDSFAVHADNLTGTKQVNGKYVSYKYTDTGAFSINGSLKYAHPVRVEGQLYVNGIFKYKGQGASDYSQTDLICLGGLYCLNTEVHLPATSHGDVDLPNVTSIQLDGDIGLHADLVTKIELKNGAVIGRSLNLPNCKNFTVASGCKITGSLLIADDGKVVNNGQIGEKVSCGTYEGSGTVGLDLIINKDTTSKITGSGTVGGNIWTEGSINIKTTGTLGGRNTYIFAKKNISIENARFYYESDYYARDSYILSTGGDIDIKNCPGFVPKVWNMKGYIRFYNDSEAHRSNIQSVLSYGSYLYFGYTTGGKEGLNYNYQTVTGNVEWYGSASDKDWAIDTWSKYHTVFKGDVIVKGTGNVHFSNVDIQGTVYLQNTGTAANSDGSKIARLYVNSTSSKTVTKVEFKKNSTITGGAYLFGNSNTEIQLGSVNGEVFAFGGKSVKVLGNVGGYFWADGVTTMQVDGTSGAIEVSGGTLTTNGKVANNLTAYNANLYVYGDIGGNLFHSAPNNSSASTMKVVQLGSRSARINIGAGIIAHGRVIDNSIQLSASYVWVKGAYYVDFLKSFRNCQGVYFTGEANGSCTVIGAVDDYWDVYTPFNIEGRMVILAFYQSSNKWHKINFYGEIRANSLVVNSELDGTGNVAYIPNSSILYSDGYTGAYLEDFKTYSLTGNIWKTKRKLNATTQKDIVNFYAKVYLYSGNGYKGNCIAANASFQSGSCLFTEGQVALRSCEFKSLAYVNDKNHCACGPTPGGGSNEWLSFVYYTDGYGNRTIDGSMFVHSSSSTGGNNYFKDVKTHSNVSVYYGDNYIVDSELQGCQECDTNHGGTIPASKKYGGDDYHCHLGHPATKLFYFGSNVYLKNSHINTINIEDKKNGTDYPGDVDVDIPAARTIVWVAKGTLVVSSGSYIGTRLYTSRPGKKTLNTNKQSFHPGVFLSDTSTGTFTASCTLKDGTKAIDDSTKYEKGTCNVRGSVTLDILAYRNIHVFSGGVVAEKGNNDSDSKAYKAGLYVTTGSIVNEGEFSLFRAESGNRHYETSQAKDVNKFKPYTSAYASYVRYEYTPNSADVMAQWYLWSYTPQDTPVAYLNPSDTNNLYALNKPVGIRVNAGITSWIGGHSNVSGFAPFVPLTATDYNPSYTTTGKKSAPSKPTTGSAGTIFGDASVSAVNVHNTTTAYVAKKEFKYDTNNYNPAPAKQEYHTIYPANVAASAPTNYQFYGGRANEITAYWTYPNYDTSDIKINHPSLYWTASITNQFDTTVKTYWNTRYIPYVWKLPYDTASEKTPAKRVLTVRSAEWKNKNRNGDFSLTGWTNDELAGTDYYVTKDHYEGSTLAQWAGNIKGWRQDGRSDNNLWDVLAWNGCDTDYIISADDNKRRSKLMIFESGELPYSAFMMGNGDYKEDKTGQLISGKKICGTAQQGWWMGSEKCSYYDVGWIFYACADPADPYGSAAKDLHVVLPQGIATRFFYDGGNNVTVLGNGRVFLYLTTGDTIWFKARATVKSTSGYLWWQTTHSDACFAPPVGGVKKVNSSKYEPLLYIVGAGTDIDLIIEDMPLAAVVYMPFGHSTKLYSASNGTLKQYNQFSSMVDGRNFSTVNGKTWYSPSGNKETTSVKSNSIKMSWSAEFSQIELQRYIYGVYVGDQFFYEAAGNTYNLSFLNQIGSGKKLVPNLGKTTIYGASTKSNNRVGGKTYTLDTFLENAPSYSTKLLYWDYVGMKVEV